MTNRAGPGFSFAAIRVFPRAPSSEDTEVPAGDRVEAGPAASAEPRDLVGAAEEVSPTVASARTAEHTPAPRADGRSAHAPRAGGVSLDACARLHWDAGGRVGSYLAAGLVGFAAGLAVVLTLAIVTGTPPAVVVAVVIVVPASFLLAVRLSRAVFGQERVVFLEKALVALGATSLALLALGRGVGAGLDLAVLGIGTLQGIGRAGCLMVGCCHGRPSRWGIRYGADHARAGFPWYHVGRRLFPIQLVDGLASLAFVAAGGAAMRSAHAFSMGETPHVLNARPLQAPGAVAAGWLLGYALVRFFTELLRGDTARPLLLGLTEAQWTAAILSIALVTLGPPSAPWPRLGPVVVAILVPSALVLALARGRLRRSAWGMTSPWHVEEVHRVLLLLRPGGAPLLTSHGLCLSLRRLGGPQPRRDYVLSFLDRPLSARLAAALVDHVRFARHPRERAEIVPGATPGLVHVVVAEPPPGAEVV